MMKQYLSEVKIWMEHTFVDVMDEKSFLWIMGSLFLLGIVTKWIVIKNYSRLIRKAENMENTKNSTLRQIKTKYESIKQVNGNVANPMLFVQRHLNRCSVMHISLKRINNIINWCIIIMVAITGFMGIEAYYYMKDGGLAITYIFIGYFFTFALEMINKCTSINEKKMELTYVIVDFLSNNYHIREDRAINKANDTSQDRKIEIQQKEKQQNMEEEKILNQVIGEFLQ